MLSTQTILDQIEVRNDGTVCVRLVKATVSDGKVLNGEYHRFSLAPGQDFGLANAQVTAHLADMGFPALSDADAKTIASYIAIAQTPDKVKAYQDMVAAQNEAAAKNIGDTIAQV